MDITLLGHDCFRLKGRDATLITDPFKGVAGLTSGIDVVTVSHDTQGHTSLADVSGDFRAVTGPGEYEIKGILITAVGTFHDNTHGKDRGRNTVYLVQLDDLRVCHLGHLGHVLASEQVDEIGTVDVLFVPIGTSECLTSAQLSDVISQLEPSIVIPMDWADESTTESTPTLDRFCHEMGVKEFELLPKLSITKSSLPSETQVVVLGPKR